MSKFLNLLNKYSSILNEEEAMGVAGLEHEVGNQSQPKVATGNQPKQDLGSTEEAIPEIGDQDLIDVAKILSKFINDKDYNEPDKQKLLTILAGINNIDVKNPDSSEKIKTTISDFVSAFKSKPSDIVSDDSPL